VVGLIQAAHKALAPRRNSSAFIRELPKNARVLDIGCGIFSPQKTKDLRPDIYYVGVDVESPSSTKSHPIADEYIFTTSEEFAIKLEDIGQCGFDAVVSRHNLEHCAEPARVLRAMCNAIVPGGRLFLSFPSEASVHLPSRYGTLNFYDDKTHKSVPCWRNVLQALELAGLSLVCAHQRYRPVLPFAIGLLCEPLMMLQGRLAPYGGTWALYGFESVIWALRTRSASSPLQAVLAE
jgi:SAM-dependent methyltransferase